MIREEMKLWNWKMDNMKNMINWVIEFNWMNLDFKHSLSTIKRFDMTKLEIKSIRIYFSKDYYNNRTKSKTVKTNKKSSALRTLKLPLIYKTNIQKW